MDPKLLEALTQVLDDVGLPRAANPAVTRGVLTDLVADDARAWRGDIDVLVIAAEEGVTDAIASGDSARLASVSAALVERGVDPTVADEAIGGWRDAIAATGTAPALAPIAPIGVASGAAMIGADTAVSDLPDDAGPTGPAGTVLPVETTTEKPNNRAKILVAAAIVLFVAVIGAAAVVAASRGEDSDEAAIVDDTAVDTGDTTTTTDTTLPETTTSTDTTLPPETPAPETPAPESPAPTPTPSPSPSPSPQPQPQAPAPPPVFIPPPADPTPTAVGTNVTWTPEAGPGYWYQANFDITYNVGSPWDQIQVTGLATGHGALTTSGSSGSFVPHHNGYFTDSFQFRLKYGNSAWSNWATVTLTVYCNQSYVCY